VLQENPRRPPKAWFRRCVRGVERSGGAYDPQAVCGAQWQRKSEAEKRRLSRGRDEECSECLQANELGGAGTALIIGGIALVGYLLFAKHAAAKTAAEPACAIDVQKLDRWGEARGFPIELLPRSTPPTTEELRQAFASRLAAGEQAVFVLQDGSFWYYINEPQSTGRADNLRTDYCSFPDVEPPLEPPAPPSGLSGALGVPNTDLPPREAWTHAARQFYHWNPYTKTWQLFSTLVKPGLIGTSTHPRYDLEDQIGNAASSYDQYWIAEIFWVYAGKWYSIDDETVMVGPGDGY